MFGTEAARTHQRLYGEMILWRDRYEGFIDYVATWGSVIYSVSRLAATQMKDCFLLFLGPCCFGFRHRDHQTSSEISRRRDRPDYDDVLHDRRTGELYFIYTFIMCIIVFSICVSVTKLLFFVSF